MDSPLPEAPKSDRPATPNTLARPAAGWRRYVRQLPAAFVLLALIASAAPLANLNWWSNLFEHFRPQFVIGLAILCLPLTFQRRWFLAILALGGSIANLGAMYSSAGSPLPIAPPAPGTARMRFVSINVLQGNKRLDLLEKFIRESGADVIVMQEVTFDIAETLKTLKPIYPGQVMNPKKDSKGCALITRLPLISGRWERTPGLEAVGAIIAEIQGTPGPFAVLDIHSHKPTNEKGAASQATYFKWIGGLARERQTRGLPTIVAGDFNSTLWSRALQNFTAQTELTNVNRGILFDATWSRWLPQRLMIDHVFLTPEWQVAGREVGPDVGSDHRPVIVDLVHSR